MHATMNRRRFLQRALAGGVGLASTPGLAAFAPAVPQRRSVLSGVYPIVQTPFTEALEIDWDDLRRELHFMVRAGTHGVVWPQLASEFYTLSVEERRRGTQVVVETIAGRCPVVIGVQAPETATAVAYARHAHRVGADAVIALPPYAGRVSLQRALAYYDALAEATPLPIFLQISTGTWGPAFSVETCLNLARKHATIRYIKEEISPVPERVAAFRSTGRDLVDGVFTGNGGRHLLNELRHGSTGVMPAAHLTDVYVYIWEQYHAGHHAAARTAFNRLLALMTFGSLHRGFAKMILQRRGVFKTVLYRTTERVAVLDAEDRRELEVLWEGIKPYLRA